MGKRTNKEIERDVKRIQEAAKTATTFKEVGEMLGLTVREIMTSLERHSIINKRVRAQLQENHEQQKKARKEGKQAKIKNESVETESAPTDKCKEEIVSTDKCKTMPVSTDNCNVSTKTANKGEKGVVIDSTIANLHNLRDLLLEMCPPDGLIIVLSKTFQELRAMMEKDNEYSGGARALVWHVLHNPKFTMRDTPEEDDPVVDFCANNQSVKLFTSDFDMRERAVKKGVVVKFIRKVVKKPASD